MTLIQRLFELEKTKQLDRSRHPIVIESVNTRGHEDGEAYVSRASLTTTKGA